ncbi:MAG: fibronectin type III domain-containing protein [Clostridia bacterium]|nr:fibronectin type III domain-containing protein [Clostridia bacterium]
MKRTKKLLSLVLALLITVSTFTLMSSAALSKVTALTAYNIDDDEINLKWSAVNSADGYQVYIYNEAAKKWIKLGNTKKTCFEADDLMSAKTYKFRVRAYDKTASGYVYSPYAAITAATEPDEVEVLKASAKNKTSVTLKWSEVKRATGYQVFIYSATKGKYVRKTAVTGTTAKITGRKAGTVYKFKVRAYFKQADGTSRYGDFSDVLSVRTSGTAVATTNAAQEKLIGTSKAGTIALEHAKLSKNQVIGFECKLDRENGIKVYEVEFYYGGYEYEYEVNASSGKIISVEKSN